MNMQDSRSEVENQLDRRALIAGIGGLAAGATLFAGKAKAGPLAPPPGPIGSTGRTVQEIYDKIARTDVGLAEPRIPVQSLPGSATALHVISQPGSYYLTGNLIGEPAKNGIEVLASNVSIDLCGHEMGGGGTALGGIKILAGSSLVRVCNGSLTGWTEHAVRDVVGGNSRFCVAQHLLVSGCLGGIGFEQDGTVDQCTVVQTGDPIVTAFRGRVTRCYFANNDPGEVFAVFDAVFVENVSYDVNGLAFVCQERGLIAGNYVRGGGGIAGGAGCELIDNRVVFAGTGLSLGDSGGLIARNFAYRCGTGVIAGGSQIEIYENNVQLCNSRGIHVTGSNCNIARNQCSANGTNFDIGPGNSHGPIVNVTGVGDITSVPGADHPWANFIY